MNIFLVFISLNDLNTIDRNEHFNYNGLLILVKAKKKLTPLCLATEGLAILISNYGL